MANVFLQLLEDVGALPKKAADQYGQMQAEFNQAPIYQKMLPMSFAIKNMINQYSDQARQSRLNLDLIQGDLANRWQGRNQPGGWQRLMFEPPAENVMAAYNDILSQMFMTADLGKIKPGRLATPATKGVGGEGQTLYHGTTTGNKFTKFDLSRAKSGIGGQGFGNMANQGDVAYFTVDKEAARTLSKVANETTYIRKNMGNIEANAKLSDQPYGEVLEFTTKPGTKIKKLNYSPDVDDVRKLKSQGYDGVMFPDSTAWEGVVEGRFKYPKDDTTVAIWNTDKISSQPPATKGLVGVGVKRYGR